MRRPGSCSLAASPQSPANMVRSQVTPSQEAAAMGVLAAPRTHAIASNSASVSCATAFVSSAPAPTPAPAAESRPRVQQFARSHPESSRQLHSSQLHSAVAQKSSQVPSRRMQHDEVFHDASDHGFLDHRPAVRANVHTHPAPNRGFTQELPRQQFPGDLLQIRQPRPLGGIGALPNSSAVAPQSNLHRTRVPQQGLASANGLRPGFSLGPLQVRSSYVRPPDPQVPRVLPHEQQLLGNPLQDIEAQHRRPPESSGVATRGPQQPREQAASPDPAATTQPTGVQMLSPSEREPPGRAASPGFSYQQQLRSRSPSPSRSPPALSKRAWLYTSLPAHLGASEAPMQPHQQIDHPASPVMRQQSLGEATGSAQPFPQGVSTPQQPWQAGQGMGRGPVGANDSFDPQQTSAAVVNANGGPALQQGQQPLWPRSQMQQRFPGAGSQPAWAPQPQVDQQGFQPALPRLQTQRAAVGPLPSAGGYPLPTRPSGSRSPSPSPRPHSPHEAPIFKGQQNFAAQQQAFRSASPSPRPHSPSATPMLNRMHPLYAHQQTSGSPPQPARPHTPGDALSSAFYMRPHVSRPPSPSPSPSPRPRSPGVTSSCGEAGSFRGQPHVSRSATPSPPSSRPQSPGGLQVLPGTTLLHTHPYRGSRSPSPSPRPSPTRQGRPPLPFHTRQQVSRSRSPSPRPASPGAPSIAAGGISLQYHPQGSRSPSPSPRPASPGAMSVLAGGMLQQQQSSSRSPSPSPSPSEQSFLVRPPNVVSGLVMDDHRPEALAPAEVLPPQHSLQQQQQQQQQGGLAMLHGMGVARMDPADAISGIALSSPVLGHEMRSSPEGSRSGTGTVTGTPLMTSTEDDSTPEFTSPSTSRTPSTVPLSGPTSHNTSDAGEPWSALAEGRKRLSGNRTLITNQKRRGSEGTEGPLPSRPALHAAVADGEHSYQWADGGEYFGEWRDGHPHGRGTYVSPDGEEYEGEWRYGKESGAGTLTKPDGARSYGFWLRGQRHGEVIYTPASVGNRRAEVLYLQQWEKNEMKEECVLRVAEDDVRRKQQKKLKKLERKSHAKEGGGTDVQRARDGETIYKGHRSYELMRDLQRGITFSIARAGREGASFHDPSPEDFSKIVTQQFPRMAEQKSFKWKDYCPGIFARLRETFGIDTRDYLLSLTGDRALRELPSPGKSGSVFFMSDDDRFLIKTVRKEEMHLLLLLIPKYYRHCQKHPDTLLTRFYGVHRVKPILGGTVRFVVMGNCLPTDVRLHRKYDLKGSTYGRTAGTKAQNPSAILKDLDLDLCLQLDPTTHQTMLHQIDADVALLEQLHVMDYSLLLGVHYSSWGDDQWQPPPAHQAYKTKGLNLNPLAPLVRNMVGTDPKHILSGKARLNKSQDVKAVYGNQFELDSSFRRPADEDGDSEQDEPIILTGDHHSEREPVAIQGQRHADTAKRAAAAGPPGPKKSRFPPVLPRLSSDSEASRHSQNPILSTPRSRDADAHPESVTPPPPSPHPWPMISAEIPEQAPPAKPLPAIYSGATATAEDFQMGPTQQDTATLPTQLQRASDTNRFASCFGSFGGMQMQGGDEASKVPPRAYRTVSADKLAAAAAAAAASSQPAQGSRASRFFKSLRPRLSGEMPAPPLIALSPSASMDQPAADRTVASSSCAMSSPTANGGMGIASPGASVSSTTADSGTAAAPSSAVISQPALDRRVVTSPTPFINPPMSDKRSATSPTPFISRPTSSASSGGASMAGTAAAPTSPIPAADSSTTTSRTGSVTSFRRTAAGTPPAPHSPLPASTFSISSPGDLDRAGMPVGTAANDAAAGRGLQGVQGSGQSQIGTPFGQPRRGGIRTSSEPAMALTGIFSAGQLPDGRPISPDLSRPPSGGPRGGLRQVAFRDDSADPARQGLAAELDLQHLTRARGAMGSHSFTAAAADPLLRQRNKPKTVPARRSTSLLPNHLDGLASRRKDLLQDPAHDSGDDSPLRRRSSRRLGSLHSAEQAKLGSSTPAMAIPQPQRGSSSPLAQRSPGGEKVMLYFGIIDFLQEYNFRKRMEHAMKRTVVDGKTISVVDPRQYAKRFRRSMKDTFVCKT
ncbi:hypothetical protein WJX74_002866 [Apatococcus lobatus]|uniref:1-phosphatidylinositol-4-phosphate 5-kinase n=1 Tax=Apatococcus lobatus TaxID=904363 RepID=A0AAW1RVN1_9CHLO